MAFFVGLLLSSQLQVVPFHPQCSVP